MALTVSEIPPHKEMVKNLLYTVTTASGEDLEEGLNWYDNAYIECDRISLKYDIDIERIVALVSVISPGLVWAGNVSAPEKMIDLWLREVPATEWEGFSCWKPNLIKAETILNGDLSVMRGMKVVSFFKNIMGDTEPVTVDRWSIRAALDNPHLDMDKIVPSGKTVYNAIADAHRAVGEIVGHEACDVQAVCWTVFRNTWNGKVRKEIARKKKLELVKT